MSLMLIVSIAAVAGCGRAAVGSGHGHSSASTSASAASTASNAQGPSAVPLYPGVHPYPGDSDGDNDGNSDENMLTPGHKASPADWRAIGAAVKRYYKIALADDGASACAMFARSLARSILIEYGRYGPAFLHGSTCAGIMSKLFRHRRIEVVAVAATQKLIDVRLEGDHGYAVLHINAPCLRGSCVLNTRKLNIANVLVQREGDSWKIDSMLATV